MDFQELSTYLSPDAMEQISLHISQLNERRTKGIDEDICMLKDGTVISINKMNDEYKPNYDMLKNPKAISITDECAVIVKYKEDPNNKKEKRVRFNVNSMEELESKWKRFKEVKGLKEDIYGIIYDVELTKEQYDDNMKIADLVNKLLDIFLKKNEYKFSDHDERCTLIKHIVTNTLNGLLYSGIVDSLYCPVIITNDDGEPISVKELINRDFVVANSVRINNYEDDE